MTEVTLWTTITVSPERFWAILIRLDRYEEREERHSA